MSILKVIKKNKLLSAVILTYMILFIFRLDKAVLSLKNSSYYVVEMLEIIPVIFILTSLIEAWVPKKVIIDNLGEKSGVKGAFISLLLGSVSAGPIYAAFPVCKMLLKKGASVFNIVIILSAWAVIKVPMLANEAKFLGIEFMMVRWILTTLSIFTMAYIISKIIVKQEIPMEENIQKDGKGKMLYIEQQYCIGCGLCGKSLPDYFKVQNGKAVLLSQKVTPCRMEEIKSVIQRCPVKAIRLK